MRKSIVKDTHQKKEKKAENKPNMLRKAAELLLIKREKDSEANYSEHDNVKLIHELEVFQIELELQNEELMQAKQIAERAEKKYTELYNFAPSGYLTLTKDGEIIDLNISAESLLGKRRFYLVKSSFGFFVSLDTRDVYNSFLRKIFETKLKVTCEFKLETDDGSTKYVLANGIISNISEKCLVILIDISKQKQVEYELKKAKEKAEESEKLKSSFLANMSHEIRTPMNGILGFTELLKDIKLNDEDQQSYIEIIEKSGSRMLNILNDIISISKIESQQIEVSISETNINEQVEYIYHFFKLEAKQKKLNLTFNNELRLDHAYIRTDREKVYAVLTNLVKNAIKFTQSGSIEIGSSKKGEFLEFYVKDSGPGITEAEKKVIFGRFSQGSKASMRDLEGVGLGLSIAKAYVEMLGGEIWVENNASINDGTTGATFFFTIPTIPYDEMKLDPPNEKFEKTTNNQTQKLNILVVENDEISKMLIVRMLEGLSKNILIAKNGIEAVEICLTNSDIDLVLMDINMPKMDGYEATRNIREFNKNVIIIAQTAYALVGDREKSIEAGCNDYLSKPLERDTLRNMIADYALHLAKI